MRKKLEVKDNSYQFSMKMHLVIKNADALQLAVGYRQESLLYLKALVEKNAKEERVNYLVQAYRELVSDV